MKVATIAQTRNNLSSLLKLVQHGETVLILDREQPVARLEPVGRRGDDDDTRLTRLERLGILRRAAGPCRAEPVELGAGQEQPGPGPGPGPSLLAALLAEREETR